MSYFPMKKVSEEGIKTLQEDISVLRGLANCEDKEQMVRYIESLDKKTMSNGDFIRAMNDVELANLFAALAYGRETPWSEPFDRKFCHNCPTVEGTIPETGQTMDFHECDFADGECPHGSDIVWWLQQPKEQLTEKRYVFGGYRDLNAVGVIAKEESADG